MFHVGGVVALSTTDNRELVTAGLMGLVRKELIRAESRGRCPGDVAFRFRHALDQRGRLQRPSRRRRRSRAARAPRGLARPCPRQSGGRDRGVARLPLRAGLIATAPSWVSPTRKTAPSWPTMPARRLSARPDGWPCAAATSRAAVNLLERAQAFPALHRRTGPPSRCGAFTSAHRSPGWRRARAERRPSSPDVIERARERSAGCVTERHAWFVRVHVASCSTGRIGRRRAALRETVGIARRPFKAAGDELALAHAIALSSRRLYHVPAAWVSQLRDAAERALQHAKRACSRMDEAWESLRHRLHAVRLGQFPPTKCVRHLRRAAARVEERPARGRRRSPPPSRHSLVAMQGRFDDAWGQHRTQPVGDPGVRDRHASGRWWNSWGVKVETLANEPQAVERTARSVMEHSTAIGDTWYYVLASIDLARAVCDQGRPAECLRILDENVSDIEPFPTSRSSSDPRQRAPSPLRTWGDSTRRNHWPGQARRLRQRDGFPGID